MLETVRQPLVLVVFLAYCLCAPAALADVPEFDVSPNQPDAQGRIEFLSPSGETFFRVKGLQKPSALSVNPDGSFWVADQGARQVYLLADDGGSLSVAASWRLPENFPYILRVFPDPSSGSLILAHGIGGLWRLQPDASVSQLPPPPGDNIVFSGAGALPDGRFILSRVGAETANQSMYLFSPADGSWQMMAIEWMPGEEPFVPNAVSTSGNSAYIWRVGNPSVIEGTLSGNVFRPLKAFHPQAPAFVAGTTDGGLVAGSIEAGVVELSGDGQQIGSFIFYALPTSLGFLPGRKLIALSYEHPTGSSWPEIQDELLGQQERAFDWAQFKLWVGWATGLGLVWSIITILFGRSGPSAQQLPMAQLRGSAGLRRAILALAALGSMGGLWLAGTGQKLLLSNVPRTEWLPPYIAGAFLVALSLEAWRRVSQLADEPSRFSPMMRQPAPPCSWLYMVPTLGIGILAAYVCWMGVDQSFFGLRESAFSAGLALVLAMVLAEAVQCRRELLEFVRREWLLFGLPLAAGCVTFFYRLVDVPYNCHFDFTLNSFFAAQLLRGRSNGAWDWGYVPGPALGTLPEIVGILVGGFTPFGYRIGNSLFNLTGIFAAYLLGKTYRNARVGFWGALALAGNIPFIHFGRLQSNGSSATTALWTVALFALALKHKRISLWVLTGLASGFSFYQWPVARVGFTAVGCTYGLILLRYPTTQRRQSRQLLAGLFTFLLMIAPLIVMWQVYPQRFMPRAGASMSGISWENGWLRTAAEHPTLQLLYRSFGWLFNEYDRSTQGTISPGFNPLEAVLFACGCVVLLIEGVSFNVLLGIFLLITFLVCGAFAVGPPWYTRLLPTAPVACILLARTIEGLHNLTAARRWLFRLLLPISGAALIALSTVPNFQRYVAFETQDGFAGYPLHPMVSIARRIHQIGPEPTYIFLARGERRWILKDLSAFGVMLPYVHGLRIKEVYDLANELQVPQGSSKAFVVQLSRRDSDLAEILKAHPGSPVETIVDINGNPVALLVMVKR